MKIKVFISNSIHQHLIVFTICFLSVSGFSQVNNNTKLKVVTHATGQCTNPADSKAGLRISAENEIDIDCNLRLSKDGELVLAHNPVSDKYFWNELNKIRIPYKKKLEIITMTNLKTNTMCGQ